MPKVIHARRRDGAWWYREWSTIVDAYTTPEMDETATREYLRPSYSIIAHDNGIADAEIGDRLNRARSKGTSSLVDNPERFDADGAWETERCEGKGGCGGFHHAFAPYPAERGCGVTCGQCGEPESDRAHGPACVPVREPGRVVGATVAAAAPAFVPLIPTPSPAVAAWRGLTEADRHHVRALLVDDLMRAEGAGEHACAKVARAAIAVLEEAAKS